MTNACLFNALDVQSRVHGPPIDPQLQDVPQYATWADAYNNEPYNNEPGTS